MPTKKSQDSIPRGDPSVSGPGYPAGMKHKDGSPVSETYATLLVVASGTHDDPGTKELLQAAAKEIAGLSRSYIDAVSAYGALLEACKAILDEYENGTDDRWGGYEPSDEVLDGIREAIAIAEGTKP